MVKYNLKRCFMHIAKAEKRSDTLSIKCLRYAVYTRCSLAMLLLWFYLLNVLVEFLCCLNLMYVFIVLVKFG